MALHRGDRRRQQRIVNPVVGKILQHRPQAAHFRMAGQQRYLLFSIERLQIDPANHRPDKRMPLRKAKQKQGIAHGWQGLHQHAAADAMLPQQRLQLIRQKIAMNFRQLRRRPLSGPVG